MYSFARASITKYHRLCGLNNRHLFSHPCSRDLKSMIKVLAKSVFGEGFLPGLQMTAFLLFSHMVFSLCVDIEREREGKKRKRERERGRKTWSLLLFL